MPRNNAFYSSAHEPLRTNPFIDIQHDRVTGPFSFLNPTRAAFKPTPSKDQSFGTSCSPGANHIHSKNTHCRQDNEQSASKVEFQWRSRDNRKGRHTLVVDPSSDSSAPYLTPKATSSALEILRGIGRMCTQFPYWDVSYLVATIFTLGSCVWVINAFFVFLPLVQPKTEFSNEILVGGGVTAFIGATIFEIGSVLLLIEAVNENRSGCFGWALEQAVLGDEGGKNIIRVRPDKDRCIHHHTNKGNFVGKGSIKQDPSEANPRSSASAIADPEKSTETTSAGDAWVWFPSWHELKIHYLRELGFLASLAQFCGATIFWISGFTALPGVNNKLSHGLLDGIYWVPQIVGGTGFIISGSLYMLETQPKWYLPAWEVLGWYVFAEETKSLAIHPVLLARLTDHILGISASGT